MKSIKTLLANGNPPHPHVILAHAGIHSKARVTYRSRGNADAFIPSSKDSFCLTMDPRFREDDVRVGSAVVKLDKDDKYCPSGV